MYKLYKESKMVQEDNRDNADWDDVRTWPWPSILDSFYGAYDYIVRTLFAEEPELANFLAEYSYVSVRYDPGLVDKEPERPGEGTSPWDDLGVQATDALRETAQAQGVPPEYAVAIDVGSIGVSFGSPPRRGACRGAPEWHNCVSTGRRRMVCCS